MVAVLRASAKVATFLGSIPTSSHNSGICGEADEAVLNKVIKLKSKKLKIRKN